MENYSVTIIESSRDLSLKERVAVKNLSEAIALGDICVTEPLDIDVDYWVHLHVVNNRSDEKEYETFIIYDKDGTCYTTSSESFWTSFKGIWDEIILEPDTEWKLRVLSKPSKNRQGKTFLTCTII